MTVPLKIDIHPFPYIPQTYYPHMSPEDTQLWNRYIKANPEFADFVYYDVPVGTLPHNIEPDGKQITEKYVRQTYLKRIDALTHRDNTLHVIELKPHAGMIALGQTIMYRHLLFKLLKGGYHIIAMIVTDQADVDLSELTDQYDIRLIELDNP